FSAEWVQLKAKFQVKVFYQVEGEHDGCRADCGSFDPKDGDEPIIHCDDQDAHGDSQHEIEPIVAGKNQDLAVDRKSDIEDFAQCDVENHPFAGLVDFPVWHKMINTVNIAPNQGEEQQADIELTVRNLAIQTVDSLDLVLCKM